MNVDMIENVAVELLRRAVIYLPEDVKRALQRAYENEDNAAAKTQLEAILRNIKLAEENEAPVCQDTGLINFYVSVGGKLWDLVEIEEALRRATRRATREVPLRPNAVDIFTEKNTGDNTGRMVPHINWEFTTGDVLEITAFPKGGGSENMCALRMASPGEGLSAVKRFVVDSVLEAGAKPCPPVILGVGIGGGSDIAMKLAKKALLRPLDQPNQNPEAAKLEEELLKAVNMTGIGPMGVGGRSTCLGVKVEYAHRHVASYPVAVAFQCWAARRASARIHPDGSVEYLTR